MRSSVLVPVLLSGFRGTGGSALLYRESQGLGIDFTSSDGLGSIAVRDTTAPGNNRNNVQANPFLTNTNASTKWVLGPNGVWVNKPANAVPIEYGVNGYYALAEPAATNLCLQSDDFTNASWTKSNMSTAKTATGADGAANSASTLTASAGNATALQAITSGSASRVTSCLIKRRTGTGNIDLTQDNGGTWATQVVTSAWARYSIAAATAANPTVGIRIVTNGDAVDVMWFDHELTLVTSPIPTTTVAIARTSDAISLTTTAFPYQQAVGTLLLGFRLPTLNIDAVSGNYSSSIAFMDGTNERIRIRFSSQTTSSYHVNPQVFNDSGTTQADVDVTHSGVSSPALGRAALAWAANDFVSYVNGAQDGTDASVTPPTAVGSLLMSGAAFRNLYTQYRSIVYVPRRMSNAELVRATSL